MTYFKVYWRKFKGTPAIKSFSTFTQIYLPEEIGGVRAVLQKIMHRLSVCSWMYHRNGPRLHYDYKTKERTTFLEWKYYLCSYFPTTLLTCKHNILFICLTSNTRGT